MNVWGWHKKHRKREGCYNEALARDSQKTNCIWKSAINSLYGYAKALPHAVYAAFSHELPSKWNHLLWVVDWRHCQPCGFCNHYRVCNPPQVIPALTDQNLPGDLIQELIALPIYLGGLGLTNPLTSFSQIHTTSKLISAALVEWVVHCPLLEYTVLVIWQVARQNGSLI